MSETTNMKSSIKVNLNMKAFVFILSLLPLAFAHAQEEDFNALLDTAKARFQRYQKLDQRELKGVDYHELEDLLLKAVALEPNNAEARYYLAYAYSRINASSGENLISTDLNYVLKASEQLERVLEISPVFEGEIFILGPQGKISAEWGSLAYRYWYDNKIDSAIWALKEGRARGGFTNFQLKALRLSLDECTPNAVLMSSGDLNTFNLLYLQLVEKYRTDVSVVDITLLNGTWYPRFLIENNLMEFDLPVEVLDTIQYCRWSDSTIVIGDFSWVMEPTYYNQCVLRGDRVFLSFLQQNQFERSVFFTTGQRRKEALLSLDDDIITNVLVNKLNPTNNYLHYKRMQLTDVDELMSLSSTVNFNNIDEHRLFDLYRVNVLIHISHLEIHHQEELAIKFMKIIDEKANPAKYPFLFESTLEYYNRVRNRLFAED